MSLLKQDSPETLDDAARGEELTKGSSHFALAGIIAALLIAAAVAVLVIASEKPPAASGEILQVWAHPMHTETSGFDANGEAMAKQSFEQVLVFARVKLHNRGDHPLFLHQILTNATLEDGIHTSFAASAADYDRLFIAYPDLAALHIAALSPQTTLDPGQTQEGMVVSAFRLSRRQWEARKDLSFTFAFQYQPSLTIAPRAAVIER
jgi:hypothetical protein